MGAYENPQIGMIDYTLGQKAFDSAFNTMYTIFSNYYANIDKEKKAINKEIKTLGIHLKQQLRTLQMQVLQL